MVELRSSAARAREVPEGLRISAPTRAVPPAEVPLGFELEVALGLKPAAAPGALGGVELDTSVPLQ